MNNPQEPKALAWNEFDEHMPSEGWAQVECLRVPLPVADWAWMQMHLPAHRPLSSVAADLLYIWAAAESLSLAELLAELLDLLRETGRIRRPTVRPETQRRGSGAAVETTEAGEQE